MGSRDPARTRAGKQPSESGAGVLGLIRIQNREREEEEILKIFTFSERREREKKFKAK